MIERKPFTPRVYQGAMLAHMLEHERCALWAGCGTGKTVAVLTLIDALYLGGETRPTLILGPLRVARKVWSDEVQKWDHLAGISVVPIIGSEKERLAALRIDAPIYTINYDNLVWLIEYWGERWPYATVVADESDYIKGHRISFRTAKNADGSDGKTYLAGQGAKRAGALAKIAHSHTKRFIELTGTPAPNGLVDLWGQIWYLDRGQRLGRTFDAFKKRWFEKSYDGFGSVPHAFANDQIHAALNDICLTIDGKDWFDLKKPIVNNIYVDLGPKARKLYKDMEKEMFLQLEDSRSAEAFGAAARTQKCLQLANGAIYLDPLADSDTSPRSKEWRLIHDEKIEALQSIAHEAAGEALLVCYEFKSDLARLLHAFPKGRVMKTDKDIEDFIAGKTPMLFLHPKCLGADTQVLTERRGWATIVSVTPADKVFDGVEFVRHEGCGYSGYETVTDVFGITMTPEHKLWINDTWVEGQNVGIGENVRRQARYTYQGDDPRIGAMLGLRHGSSASSAELYKAQSRWEKTLSEVQGLSASSRQVLGGMAGYASAGLGYVRQKLRRPRGLRLPGVAKLRCVLRGHARGLCLWANYRAGKWGRGIFKGELHLGDQHGAASQQAKQSESTLQRRDDPFGRTMPPVGHKQDDATDAAESGDVRGRSRDRRGEDPLRQEPSAEERNSTRKAHVYDLINCGPRHQFAIRNSDGEVFISHNSGGHGVDGLQYACRHIVFFGHNWSLGQYQQVIERIGPVRQMQANLDRLVFIHHIIARSTVDELVMERRETKREVQDILLDACNRSKKS